MIRATVCLRFVSALLIATLGLPWVSAAQPRPAASRTAPATGQEMVAVLDLEPVGATKPQAVAATDRLREELLRSGSVILVERSQMDAILNEQALQQTGCTSQECAVQVGKVLGVRKIVSGRVTRVDTDTWLLSASLLDVETAQTLRAESVQQRGEFSLVLDVGIVSLTRKITAGLNPARPDAQALVAAAPAASVDAQPGAPAQPEASNRAWMWWALGGVGAAAVVAEATKPKSKSKSSPSTGSATFSW